MTNIDLIYITIATILIIIFGMFQSKIAKGENRSIRSSKDVVISTSIGGHLPTLLTTPIRIGYFSSESLLIETEWGSRSFEYDKNDSITHIDGKIDNLGISSRWFFNNPFSDSFNLLTALNRRSLEMNCQVEIDDEINASYSGVAKYTDNYLKVEVITLSTSIGNQWIWSNGIFLNVDWWMPVWIISSHVEIDVDVDVDIKDKVTRRDLSKAEDDLEDFSEDMKEVLGSNGWLIITFGWSF